MRQRVPRLFSSKRECVHCSPTCGDSPAMTAPTPTTPKAPTARGASRKAAPAHSTPGHRGATEGPTRSTGPLSPAVRCGRSGRLSPDQHDQQAQEWALRSGDRSRHRHACRSLDGAHRGAGGRHRGRKEPPSSKGRTNPSHATRFFKPVKDLDLFVRFGVNPQEDGYPGRHSMHVAMLSSAIGATLGWDERTLIDVGVGCLTTTSACSACPTGSTRPSDP